MANPILAAVRGLTTSKLTGASLARTALIVVIYLAVGVAFYMYILDERHADDSKWTLIDTLYFSMVTMSTVGYGDLSPSTRWSRAFTCFYILVGVTFVFGAIAQASTGLMLVLEQLVGRLTALLLRSLGIKQKEQVAVDLDGDGQVDFVEPPGPIAYYAKGTAFWVLALALLQVGAAAAFLATQDDWSWEDALYHCLVTMTTVGYGDVTITTQAARLVAFFHIFISVTWLATFISKVQALSYNRKQELKRSALLKKQLDVALITSLDTNGDGVNKLEFVVGMLTKLELIDWADVEPFLAQFDALDSDGSGVLTAADLAEMVKAKQQQVEAKKEAKKASPKSHRKASSRADLVADGKPDAMTDVEQIGEADADEDGAALKDGGGHERNGGKYAPEHAPAQSSPPKGNKVAPTDFKSGRDSPEMIVADCSQPVTPRAMNGDGKEPAS